MASVRVLHAAVFSNGQALAGACSSFMHTASPLPAFQAFGGGLVGGGHGAVALDVGLGFLVEWAWAGRQRWPAANGGNAQGGAEFFHGDSFQVRSTNKNKHGTGGHQGCTSRSATSVR
jgi:hypothetical protein